MSFSIPERQPLGLNEAHPNILITSVGRRAYLVSWFKEALARTGEVHVSNSHALTPAFMVADHAVVSPLIYSTDYIPFLLNYCKTYKIGAILPLFDVDVPILAEHADEFKSIGCLPIVASKHIAEICNDKFATTQFLDQLGLPTLQSFVSLSACQQAIQTEKLCFPIMIKPRWGMGSIGVFTCNDKEELPFLHRYVKEKIEASYLKYESAVNLEESVLMQEMAPGQEWGMDIMNDLNGNFAGVSTRKKTAMRSGETDTAEMLSTPPELEALAKKLSAATAHLGNMDVDVFVKSSQNGAIQQIQVLEMNARFGGGYPFSHAAGVNLPQALIMWLQNKEVPADMLRIARPGIYQKDITIVQLS